MTTLDDLHAELDGLNHYLKFAPLAERGTPEHQVKVDRPHIVIDLIEAERRK